MPRHYRRFNYFFGDGRLLSYSAFAGSSSDGRDGMKPMSVGIFRWKPDPAKKPGGGSFYNERDATAEELEEALRDIRETVTQMRSCPAPTEDTYVI